MPAIKTAEHAADSHTRESILAAARERYRRFGAPKTTMDEIAREAGCSRATVYLYFPGKRTLYAGLLEADLDAFLKRAEGELDAEPNAQRALRRMVQITHETFADNAVLRAALEGDEEMTIEPVARAAIQAAEAHIIRLLRDVLARGVDQGTLRPIDPERVAYLMYHLGNYLLVRETTGTGDYPFNEILGLMDDVFARGISA